MESSLHCWQGDQSSLPHITWILCSTWDGLHHSPQPNLPCSGTPPSCFSYTHPPTPDLWRRVTACSGPVGQSLEASTHLCTSLPHGDRLLQLSHARDGQNVTMMSCEIRPQREGLVAVHVESQSLPSSGRASRMQSTMCLILRVPSASASVTKVL